MLRRILLLAVLACTAQCRQVLGIDEPEPDRRALRLWTVAIATPTRVTLRNTGNRAMELDGLALRFDDSGPYPTPTACEARLSERLLPGYGSVRVHEEALPGDLAGLTGTCGEITLHVKRPGRLYLCDGDCAPGNVIDMVAFLGSESVGVPPEALFGTRFDNPLAAVDDGLKDAFRYQRLANDGASPDFLGSDWAVQPRTLFADFENGLTFSISNEAVMPWTMPVGTGAFSVPDDLGFSGASSLRITHAGGEGNEPTVALSANISTISRPRAISYFAHAASLTASAGQVELVSLGTPVITLGFEATGLGASLADGGRVERSVAVDRWYQVELRDIDWDLNVFDLYVDRVMIEARVPFKEAADAVDEIRIYSASGPSVVHLDDLELWGE